ncbi:hypothetical protein PMAYCL1PPCAC_22842, partial [Pristionchus mayeri]
NKEVVYRWDMCAGELGMAKYSMDEPLLYQVKESPNFFVAGIPWMLKVSTEVEAGEERVYLTINCIHEEPPMSWKIEQASTLTIINAKPEDNAMFEFTKDFSIDAPEWSIYMTYTELFDEQKGFIINGEITVEARITVKKMIGIKQSMDFDFSSPSVFGSDDVVLVVEGKNVHVSKNYLSALSPYFNNLFFKNFKESKMTEIKIPEVSHKRFVELLYVVYPSYRPVTHWSVFYILDLADRFDIKVAKEKAEAFLVATSRINTAEKLRLADQYKLELVMAHCLSILSTLAAHKDLKNDPAFMHFSVQLKATLHDKIMSII